LLKGDAETGSLLANFTKKGMGFMQKTCISGETKKNRSGCMQKKIAKLCSIGLCICMAMGLYIPAQAADNLMAGEAGVLESFTLLSGATIDATAGPDGGKALVLTGEMAAAEVYVDNLEANKTYGFSSMLKSNADGAAAVKVEAYTRTDGAYSKVSANSMMGLHHYDNVDGEDTYVSTANAWRPLQFNFTLPAGANAAKVTVSCKTAGETVSFAVFDVYVAANLVSNGDFEGVSIFNQNTGDATANGTLTKDMSAGNWRMNNNASQWNVQPITNCVLTLSNAEGAEAAGYIYRVQDGSGSKASQVVPVKVNQLYRLAFDWGTWYTANPAAICQVYINSTQNTQLVLGNFTSAKSTFVHQEYYFMVGADAALTDGMAQVSIYFGDNGGNQRIMVDNVILEPVNNTFTTSFSEGYATLDAMPEGGNTTVTVKNTCRIPVDAGRDGEVRNYSILVALYKMENNTVVLENVRKEDFTLTVSGEKDAIKTVTQDMAVPETGNGVEYKIVSYLWNENMKPYIAPVALMPEAA